MDCVLPHLPPSDDRCSEAQRALCGAGHQRRRRHFWPSRQLGAPPSVAEHRLPQPRSRRCEPLTVRAYVRFGVLTLRQIDAQVSDPTSLNVGGAVGGTRSRRSGAKPRSQGCLRQELPCAAHRRSRTRRAWGWGAKTLQQLCNRPSRNRRLRLDTSSNMPR